MGTPSDLWESFRMRTCAVLAFLILGALACADQQGPSTRVAQEASSSPVAVLVKHIGSAKDGDPTATLAQLHQHNGEAVDHLIEELSPVGDVRDPSWKHMVWCIRALRSLTGKRFEFRTTETLTARQREFLKPNRPIPFFALRMSTSQYFLAPRDVQHKIIESWRQWWEEARSNHPTTAKYAFSSTWYF